MLHGLLKGFSNISGPDLAGRENQDHTSLRSAFPTIKGSCHNASYIVVSAVSALADNNCSRERSQSIHAKPLKC